MNTLKFALCAFAVGALASTTALSAEWNKNVTGGSYESSCFRPWGETNVWQTSAKQGPYRIAVVNSFTGNTWRIQMLKTLLAYAETPEMKSKLTELKVISTGTDVAAQIAAMEDFINQGYDAVLADAISTEGFDRVIRAADRTGTIVMTFDNVLNNENILQLSSDNVESGRLQGEFLAKHMNGKGKLLEVRGLAGSSVEEDRHNGLTKVIKQYGDIEVVEVWGNWDDGTGQKVVADAIATHGKFDGMSVQAGTTGAMRALLDAKHPLIPVAGEAENGYRKIMAEKKAEGLEALSVGYSPALGAIAVKAAVAALEGHALPRLMAIPLPVATSDELVDGKNFWSDLDDNFFTPNEFPPCNVNFTAQQIMSQELK